MRPLLVVRRKSEEEILKDMTWCDRLQFHQVCMPGRRGDEVRQEEQGSDADVVRGVRGVILPRLVFKRKVRRVALR